MTTSGIRVGTPAITTRGMKESEMELIAFFIKEALENKENEEKLNEIHLKVKELTKRFPLN
jgi:glycine hydroxymethyltransferase